MSMSGSGSGAAYNAFLLIPSNLGNSMSWTDSSNADGIKTTKTYILKSIKGNEGIVTLLGVINGTKKLEMQGMELNAIISGKVDGQIIVDISTGIVKKNNSVTEMTNSMEIMGMSIPVTGKIIASTTYMPSH